jgi:hypothetical protein
MEDQREVPTAEGTAFASQVQQEKSFLLLCFFFC